MAKVTLRKTRETRVRGGHPWIYASEIEKVDGAFENGDVVDVCDFRGKFIGRGFYNPQSQISRSKLFSRYSQISSSSYPSMRDRITIQLRMVS